MMYPTTVVGSGAQDDASPTIDGVGGRQIPDGNRLSMRPPQGNPCAAALRAHLFQTMLVW
jgi:hypothetical protein